MWYKGERNYPTYSCKTTHNMSMSKPYMGPPMKTRKNKVPSGREKIGNDKTQSKERQGRVDLLNGHAMLICMEAGWEYDHRDGWEDTDHLSTFRATVQLF